MLSSGAIRTGGRMKSYGEKRMRQEKMFLKRFRWNLWLPIVMAAALLVIGIRLTDICPEAGYLLCIADGIYLIFSVIQYEYLERNISMELRSAGFEQGQVQKSLLKELPVPYVLTDCTGDIIWYNQSFLELMDGKVSKKNITQMFSGLYKKVFPQKGSSKEVHITCGEKKYCVNCKNVIVNEVIGDTKEKPDDENVLAFYFFDETRLVEYQEESRRKSLVAGLIYIDNYEEVLESMEEVRQSLLLALVERKIVKYMKGLDAIIKKFEKDKFIFVFEEKNLEKLMESRFSILDEVRAINIGNDLSITLSISVGVNAPGYMETYESARIAMDLALGRGGDQAVVRDGDAISYYGGKTQKVEKSTRVKARVKAHALREIILTHEKIFIMGHRNPDADSMGAALGIYRLARTLEKKAYIVMNQDYPAVTPIVNGVMSDRDDEEEVIFVTNEQALQLYDDTSMMVILDVNIPGMTECPELIKQAKTIVVLDHHRQT